MALGRAVESGFALARSASHGLLTASDAYGGGGRKAVIVYASC